MVSGVQPFTAADDRLLEQKIATLLADRHLPGLRQLEIAASRGTVTLRGRVRSFYEKQLCQIVCRRAAGVVQFVDDVVVT